MHHHCDVPGFTPAESIRIEVTRGIFASPPTANTILAPAGTAQALYGELPRTGAGAGAGAERRALLVGEKH